jgi:hypothetical protein
MEDFFKPRGEGPGNKPDAGKANIRRVPVFATVKDNVDPIRSGRLRVYIADFSGNEPDNSKSWITVSYMTPFYGKTNGNSSNTGYGNYKNSPHSYGMWTSPPDIGTTVICIFVNGDPNFGFWIGCVPSPDALHMVPAIGASSKIIANEQEAQSYGGAVILPVTNINPANPGVAQTNEFLNETKPVHSYAAAVYNQQGLIRDNIRGPITTSAQRETPSRVGFGVSTPGRPIYEGGFTDDNIDKNLSLKSPEKLKIVGRRGGHTFVMDDGDIVGKDKLVRIRTALGHQILLSDSGQCLHIIHANGQSWIELGKEGTIDMYSTNSVNIRTQGDLNLHADNNININAAKELSIQAESIKINSEKNIAIKSGADFSGYAMGKYTFKVDGAMAMSSGGEGSYASASTMFVNGTKVNLNSGKASTIPVAVPPLVVKAHTDTLYDPEKGFAAAPGKLLSITSRAPAHAPWANAGQGVNVQTKLSAADNLPKPASNSVAAVVVASSGSTTPGPTVATTSTVPPPKAVSQAIDKNATTGLLAAQSTMAATGPAAQATKTGVTIVTTNGVSEAFVGKFAMTPKQMQDGGYLLPGSSEKINANIMAGLPPERAFDPAFFTGKGGVSSLAQFINNIGAQTDAQTTNMQKAQTGLQNTGTITGNESASQIGGPILAGSQLGVSPVLDAIKTVSGNIVGDIKTKLQSAQTALSFGSNVTNLISVGNLATNLADKVTGGLSSLSTSVDSLKKLPGIEGIIENTKSVSAAAFKAITDSFKPFAANKPVNLLEIAKANAAEQNNTDPTYDNLANRVPGIALKQLGVGDASGVSNLPGGQAAAAAVVKASGNTTASVVAGVKGITNNIDALSTAATNNVSTQSTGSLLDNVKSLAGNLAQNPLRGLTAGITSQLDNLKGLAGNLAQNALRSLPAGVAAQVQAAMSAIGSGGSASVKLPEVATNTNDRSGLDKQASSLLGDSSIPVPNYNTEIKDLATSTAELDNAKSKLQEEITKLTQDATEASVALSAAKFNFPEGSPEIDRLKNLVSSTQLEVANVTKKLIG